MSKESQPAGEQPGGTGGEQPTAIPPTSTPVATDDTNQLIVPDGYKLIKDEDYKNLVSSRDRANNEFKEVEAVTNNLARKDAIRDAIADPEFKSKYPDVSFEDILEGFPSSDDEIIQIAEAKQKRFEQIKLDHVKNAQRVVEPVISASDLAEQEKVLKQPSSESRFMQALKLRRTKTT